MLRRLNDVIKPCAHVNATLHYVLCFVCAVYYGATCKETTRDKNIPMENINEKVFLNFYSGEL